MHIDCNENDRDRQLRVQANTATDFTDAEKMVVTLSRVSDTKQRSYALADRLKNTDVQLAVNVITLIWERTLVGKEDFIRLYNGLVVTGILNTVLGPKKMSELIAEAQSRSAYGVAAILMDLPHAASNDLPYQPFLDAGLKETPLGMRKALARKPDLKLIQRIAKDQDYRVIEALLDNPRLTETDVIRIGSTRPTSAKVLEVIYNHPKWISRYRIKRVIALNPHSPLSMAMRLLTFLSMEDLREICDTQDLDETLQMLAERIIEDKERLSAG